MEQNYDFPQPRIKWLPAGNRELIFGLFAILLGLFTANMVIFGGFALGFAIAHVLCTAATFFYLRRCGLRLNGYTGALLVLSVIIAAGFGWSADSFVKGWLFLFLLAGVNLAFCLMAGRNRFTPGSARSLLDAARTVFYFGVGHSDQACRGVATAFRSGGELTRRSGAVLAGLGIALPALVVVIPLQISRGEPDGTGPDNARRSIATITIIANSNHMADRINAILHEYGSLMVGRMGMPYRECGLYLINITLDGTRDSILELSHRLNLLPNVSVKTTFAKGNFDTEADL